MRPLTLVGICGAFAAAGAAAQAPPSYRAPADTLYWVSDNPFRLFVLRDGDTIPGEVRGISVSQMVWAPSAEGFRILEESADVGLIMRRETDSMTVSPGGAVLTVNGGKNYNDGEWDALLRLPPASLAVGHEWSDTIAHATEGPRGPGWFEVRRHYRVAREIDSAGIAGLEVTAAGELLFRLSMWTDSAAGRYRWFDLTGPSTERYIFDPEEGQLVLRDWSMLLEGIGGDFDGTASDTVPAGLRSANIRYRIPAERAHALMAALPGSDTSVTIRADGAGLFLHTMGRDRSRLVAGFRRADGMTGAAEMQLEEADRERWTFRWVAPTSDIRREVIVHEDSLRHDGSTIVPPTDAWAVAEYGMWETVIPSLERLGAIQDHPLSIYRPTAGTWDRMTVTTRPFDGFSVDVLEGEDGTSVVLVMDAEGLLLYQETLDGQVTRESRVPYAEHRRMQFQEILTKLRGG